MLAVTALWWAFTLTARQAAFTLPWAVSSATAHGLVMTLGFMPFFITGFAFTAGPRWLGVPEVSTRVLQAPLSSMFAGWAIALLGFHVAAPMAAAGVATVADHAFDLVQAFGAVHGSKRPCVGIPDCRKGGLTS